MHASKLLEQSKLREQSKAREDVQWPSPFPGGGRALPTALLESLFGVVGRGKRKPKLGSPFILDHNV